MACIYREIHFDAPAEFVWDAVRDVGALHSKLVPGVVLETELEVGARTVKFANGMVVRELIVDVNEQLKRVSYASVGGRASHHNASMQVFEEGPRGCRIVWVTDVLPNELATPIGSMVELGAQTMKKTLEGRWSAKR